MKITINMRNKIMIRIKKEKKIKESKNINMCK